MNEGALHICCSLITAFHIAFQDSLPITMVAAGLPQIPSQMVEAKTYAERLFEFHHIGKLNYDAAIQALVVPVEKLGVHYKKDALEEIIKQTEGYAYFLQEWGKSFNIIIGYISWWVVLVRVREPSQSFDSIGGPTRT